MSTAEHHSLDDVAKELASGAVSRRQALKLIGAALAGAGLALIPGVASATPPQHANAGGRSGLAPPSHAQDQEGFEPGTGGRFGSGETCTGPCSSNSDCPPGCQCNLNPELGVFQCLGP